MDRFLNPSGNYVTAGPPPGPPPPQVQGLYHPRPSSMMDPSVMHLTSLNHQAQSSYENAQSSQQQQAGQSSAQSIQQQFASWTPPQLRSSCPQHQTLVQDECQVDPISLSFTPSPEELNPKDF